MSAANPESDVPNEPRPALIPILLGTDDPDLGLCGPDGCLIPLAGDAAAEQAPRNAEDARP